MAPPADGHRHSLAVHHRSSHLAERGVPLIAVQRYIGHKSGSKITEEIYTHITKKMSDTITESIDTLID